MKIGILVNDRGINNMDLSYPSDGNPGVGGTLYCFVSLIYHLLRGYDYDITTFHYEESNILPQGCLSVIISSPYDSIAETQKRNLSFLIHEQMYGYSNWYHEIEKNDVDTILWAHNYLFRDELIQVPLCQNVKRVVFVGREEYDYYMDHDVSKKSVYIYNICEDKKLCSQMRDKNYGPIVTYVGSLVKVKGFHLLAKEWKKILHEVPEAQLEVIGSGKLYDRSQKLGAYGIADEAYESEFMRYLTNRDGELLNSVHFEGLVGTEKNEIFSKTYVGVVNPSAKSETFCLSAVEMEMAGIPVVTCGKHGLLDTVSHGESGLLFQTRRQMRRNIVKLLKNSELRQELGNGARQFVQNKFGVSELIQKWNQLFEDIFAQNEPQFLKPQGNWTNDLKWLRYLNRHMRKRMHWVPTICKMRRDLFYIAGVLLKREKWKQV